MAKYVALFYFIFEAITFWAISSIIGVGFSFLLLFLLMILGCVYGLYEVKRIIALTARSVQQSGSATSIGKAAGNMGIACIGIIMVMAPGIGTSIIGLLLLIPPIRAIILVLLIKKIRLAVEQMGVTLFERMNPQRTAHHAYGNFYATDTSAAETADIKNWIDEVQPQDFESPEGK